MEKKDKKSGRDKEAEKEAKRLETNAAVQKDYEAKKAGANSGSTIDKLKVWLDNTPFKSDDSAMKRDTFDHIIALVMQLKETEIKTLCDSLADPKLTLTLAKYIFEAFSLIHQRDAKMKLYDTRHILKV